MTDTPVLRLGTRNSPLAMAQAEETRRRLCEAHGWSENAVELVPVVASGDKVLDRPLAEVGGKALWTKELDGWLHAGEIDVSVHSMKDVETLRPDWLTIAAILPRADKRDMLVGAESIAAIPQDAVVGTSAPRRAAQMLHHRPDVKVVTFRGNVATRLRKLSEGEADVTLLAAAGLERLGQLEVGSALDEHDWLPAPSQGAIGLECRTGDARVRKLLAPLDHGHSRAEVLAERGLLEALQGTCHSPVAVLANSTDQGVKLRAAIFSPDGKERVDGEGTFHIGEFAGLQALAEDMLERASPAIRAVFGGGG
ncbi:hydroxymethylbilane synthase [Parerythrobacter aestuarii]|uniref:hydroxymethylbilane synthase n=1 Tax=Parerythrobacter aestuarii TaxID=3020909 RepID=UPI0024DEAB3B|nr:hydroxymethylbilane synthase [Parerythrobacter aestuarii]